MIQQLISLSGIGVQSATVLVREFDGEILAIEQGLRALDSPAGDVSLS